MVDKVIPIRPVPPPDGTPEPEVIAILERLLDEAKQGRITGVAFVLNRPAGTALAQAAEGWIDRAVVGRLYSLMHQLSCDLDDDGIE